MHKLGRLSDVEMEVMQMIWGQSSPVTVAQLLIIFQDNKGWKTSTIATMLDRIIAKGFLTKEMKGKAYHYNITATFGDYQKQEGRNFLSSLYGGSIKNFMAALTGDGDMSQEDIAELREWFQNRIDNGGEIK
jgi:BlaI family penicillinase repressor